MEASMADAAWRRTDPFTCNLVLDRRLDTDPDSPYLDVCGTSFTAAEVASIANRIAHTYVGLGVKPGDRVATLIENSPEAMLAWWGAVRGNVVAVPINTAYKGDYLVHQLVDSERGSSWWRLRSVSVSPRWPTGFRGSSTSW